MLGEGWDLPQGYEDWSDWTWWKVRGNRILVLTVLSEKPVSYVGHYVKSRMVPCLGDDCRLCHDGVGRQLRYCFAAAEVTTRRTGLLEVGRSVACQIQDWIPRHGSFRGMVLEFTRHSYSRQSRMEVTYCDVITPPWIEDIACPDVRAALITTWEHAGLELPPGVKDTGKKRFRPPEQRRA